MAKITLNNLTTNFGSQTLHNENNQSIEDALNNKVLWRDNPSGEPNPMENDFDMNSNDILNTNSVSTDILYLNGSRVTTTNLNETTGAIRYYNTVANAQAVTDLEAGMVIMIGGRANSLWDISASGTADGYSVLSLTGSSVFATLRVTNNYVDATAYGVLVGSTLDQTPAVKAAFENTAGLNVKLPVGEILLKTDLVTTTLTDITISGSNGTVLKLDPTVILAFRSPNSVIVEDLAVKGTRSNTASNSIYVSNYTNFTWQRCYFSDFGGLTINAPGSTIIYMFANDTANSTRAAGSSTGARVINCTFEGHERLTNFGVRIYTGWAATLTAETSKDSLISGCRFKGFNWNAVEVAGDTTSEAIISNCYAYKSGLVPFDLDKGAHNCIVKGCIVDRMLGNIDYALNPNTGINAFGVAGQELDRPASYGHHNLVTDCVVYFLKADIDAFPNPATFVAMFASYDSTIRNIKCSIDSMPAADGFGGDSPYGLACVTYGTISNCKFENIECSNASAGIIQTQIMDGSMSYTSANVFDTITNEGTMTCELIRQDNLATASGNARSQCIYRNLRLSTDLSIVSRTSDPRPSASSFEADFSSLNFAIIEDSYLASTHATYDMIRSNIANVGLRNTTFQGIPTNDRLINTDGALTQNIGIDNVRAGTSGRFPVDVVNLFANVDVATFVSSGITPLGAVEYSNVTLMTSGTGATPPIDRTNAKVSQYITYEKIAKVSGSNIGWINTGTEYKEYGAIL